MNRTANAAALLALLLLATGCSSPTRNKAPTPAPISVAKASSPTEFLQAHNLKVTGAPERFTATIPADWAVKQGEYPEGLYWGMVNELSKDAGLDLAPLKGTKVDVYRYELEGGLPGEGDSAQFQYPSNLVLLVQKEGVVGAWLAFNRWGIGPSIKHRNLETITGLSQEAWLQREGYFAAPGANADLATMQPGEVLAAWLEAITKGDKARAYAAMTPRALIESLTANLVKEHLYNPGFSTDNSLVESIKQGRLLSYRMFDRATMAEVTDLGDRTWIELGATLELTGGNFTGKQERTTRFAILTKGPQGWKLEGLGTGP